MSVVSFFHFTVQNTLSKTNNNIDYNKSHNQPFFYLMINYKDFERYKLRKMRVKYIGLNLVCRPYIHAQQDRGTHQTVEPSPPPPTRVAPAGTWSVPRIPFCEMTRPMYFTVEFGYHAAREAHYSVRNPCLRFV
jgi:hypothetical protein